MRQAELSLTVARLEADRLTPPGPHPAALANAADVRELGYTVSMQQRSIGELATKLRQADISSPQAGVLTWVNDNLGSTVQAGDALARVADLSSYRVRATISDTYADAAAPRRPRDGCASTAPTCAGSISEHQPERWTRAWSRFTCSSTMPNAARCCVPTCGPTCS